MVRKYEKRIRCRHFKGFRKHGLDLAYLVFFDDVPEVVAQKEQLALRVVDDVDDAPYTEDYHLGLWVTGKKVVNSWAHPDESRDGYKRQGCVRTGILADEYFHSGDCRTGANGGNHPEESLSLIHI